MATADPIAPDVVMTAAEVERLLGVSRFTLLRWRQRPGAGGLPYIRLSDNRVGYLRRDVGAFLAARRIGALLQPAAASPSAW